MDIREALHPDRVLPGAPEAEEVGQRGFAFEDQNRAAFHARRPFHAGRGTRSRHENPRHPGGLALQTDGFEDLRPGARVFGEHAEVGQFGGAGKAGEGHEASE
jgi:hypothetical protein